MTEEMIVDAALALPSEAKERLLILLRESLHEGDGEEHDSALVKLAEERLLAYREGRTTASTIEAVFDRLRQKGLA